MVERGPQRVVVADAVDGIRSLVRLTLDGDSYHVDAAGNAHQALRLVAVRRPDLVLVAADLPGAGGASVAASLKAQPETRHARVILLFDRGQQVDQQQPCYGAVDDFLAKPFNAFTLLRKVATALP